MIGILTLMDTIDWVSSRNMHKTFFFTGQALYLTSGQVQEGSHKLLQMDTTLEITNDYYMGGLI